MPMAMASRTRSKAGDDDPCTAPVDADDNGVPDYLEPTMPNPAVDGGVDAGVDGGMRGGGRRTDPNDAGPVVVVPAGYELRGGGLAGCSASPQPVHRRFLGLVLGMFVLLRRRVRGDSAAPD